MRHRGRLQVQGTDLDDSGHSWSWNQRFPPLARTAISRLKMLRGRLTRRQRSVRELAFADAESWLRRVRDQGGIEAPVIRTFQNRGLPSKYRDARVDVEVLTGAAFRRSILVK